jgi:hypothetical protein|tara:strand:- start:466 stop:1032 length:567 start_codon:yes stop_codon:yes gene_type:complete
MAIQNMLAKSSSGVSEIERRVLKAIPEWKKWTRQLKQVYVLLPVFGSTSDGIHEMCEEFGWNKEKLAEKISSTLSFKKRLDQYRKEDSYPIFPGSKKTYIKKSHLDTVYAHESAVISFMHLERAKAQGSAGVNFALKMMANGYLEHMEPVSSRPEIKYFMEDQRQPGIVQDNGHVPEADYSGDGLPDL